MPYWRKRQLRRTRKQQLKELDKHIWEENSLHPVTKSKFEVPATANSPHTKFKIQLNFQMVGMRSVRKCKKCGQESIDYKDPELSCREFVVSKVMKS